MRIAISSCAALFVTLTLFYVMQNMISGRAQPIEKPLNYGVVDFVRLWKEPADSKTESVQQMPVRRPAPTPGTVAELSPGLTAAAPPATAQAELTAGSLAPLQLSKPYLDPAIAIVAKSKPVAKSSGVNKVDIPLEPAPKLEDIAPPTALAKLEPESGASVISPLTNSGKTTAVDVPTLPTGATPELQDGSGNEGAEAIPVFRIEPKYPRKAAMSRIEGWVKLEFTITEDGSVSDPVVVDSRPRRTFDRSAIRSIRKWRFKPRMENGKPVKRKASQLIEFRLSRG